LRQGKSALAEGEALRAVAAKEKVAAAHPDVPDYQADLARGYFGLARLYELGGKTAEAQEELRKGTAILQKLTGAHPEVAQYQVDLAENHYLWGFLNKAAGKKAEAEQAFLAALEISKKLVATQPGMARGREVLASCAVELARMGTHARATAEVDALANDASAPKGDLYDAACVYSLSVAAARKDPKLSPAEREKLAERYASRAVELLRRAMQKGYRDVKNAKADKDLDPLRERPDFKQLLAELEAKGKDLPGKR
jgi:tetratricopeptide (TPR) repeat protein